MELDPNSNIFLLCGSSPVAVPAAVPLPNGLLEPKAGEAAPNTEAAVEFAAAPNVGAEDAAACPNIDPEALPPRAGDEVPKALDSNVGVEFVALAVADPKEPNVGELVAGLPKMELVDPVAAAGEAKTEAELVDPAAATAGEAKTEVELAASGELFLLAPNVNADVVDSAGFDAVVEAAEPKLNPVEPVVAELPKIELPAAVELVLAAEFAAPKVPNVDLSADPIAAAPKVGTTLLVDGLPWPKTKLDAADDDSAVPAAIVVVLVSAGLAAFDPKENADAVAVVVTLADVVELAAVTDGDPLAAAVPKLKLGVIDGPVGFWAPPNIEALDVPVVLAENTDGFVSTVDDAAIVVAVEFAVEADAAAGLGDPKENVPLPTMVAGLLSSLLVVVADIVADDPNPNEGLAGAVSVELAANDPKETALELLLADVVLGVTTVAGFPNEKPVLLTVSACLLAGEPKLNTLVVVVEVTASELFADSEVADLEPKLNPVEVAGFVDSFFSLANLELSVVSEGAVGLLPKLNLAAGAAVDTAFPLLPKLNLGFSSEFEVLVVDVTEPKLKPVLADVVALTVELAGTPKENPVVLGASFPSES